MLALISGYVTNYRFEETKGMQYNIVDFLQYGRRDIESSIIHVHVVDPHLRQLFSSKIEHLHNKCLTLYVNVTLDKFMQVLLLDVVDWGDNNGE